MRSLVALKILLHDKSTTIGSLIGVIAIVFLVGQQLSVLFGLFTYMSVLVDHGGADIWICTKNTVNINATGDLPERYVDRVAGLPAVAWAEPLLFGSGSFKTTNGGYEAAQIVGLRSPRFVAGPWRFSQGSQSNLLDYEAITLELLDLDKYGNPDPEALHEINDTRVKIAAITKGIKGFSGRLAFTNIAKAREILKTPPGRCKAVLVKLKNTADAPGVIGMLQKMLPTTEVLSAAEFSRKTRTYYVKNTGMGGSFGFSTLVGALIGIIIITLTMYTAVLQRQKDFAVLRALGARRADIFIIVLVQALIIGIVGILLGFLLLALFLNGTRDTSLPTYFPRWLPPVLSGATLLMCLLGSLLAMRKAISVEPASIFR